MVAEADESDRSFLKLSPAIAVITNIDREHMEAYGSFDRLVEAFEDFADRVPFYGAVVACLDDPPVAAMMPRLTRRVVTYGFARRRRRPRRSSVDRRALRTLPRPLRRSEGSLAGPAPGRSRCTCPASTTCRTRSRRSPSASRSACRSTALPAPWPSSAAPSGAIRREGLQAGVTVVDDYGHHPTEVAAVLRAARAGAAVAARRRLPAPSVLAHARPARRLRSGARARRCGGADGHLPGWRSADSRRDARRPRRGGARDRGRPARGAAA